MADDKRPKPPTRHGGRRPGAGRKPSEAVAFRDACTREIKVVRSTTSATMDAVVLPELEAVFLSLVRMAKGERAVDSWRPLTAESLASAVKDDRGEPTTRKGPDGDEVLVGQVIVQVEPDRAAAIYLVDRYLGRPIQSVEVSEPDRVRVPPDVTTTIDRVWGEPGN